MAALIKCASQNGFPAYYQGKIFQSHSSIYYLYIRFIGFGFF